jgi:hypothetical protein
VGVDDWGTVVPLPPDPPPRPSPTRGEGEEIAAPNAIFPPAGGGEELRKFRRFGRALSFWSPVLPDTVMINDVTDRMTMNKVGDEQAILS